MTISVTKLLKILNSGRVYEKFHTCIEITEKIFQKDKHFQKSQSVVRHDFKSRKSSVLKKKKFIKPIHT